MKQKELYTMNNKGQVLVLFVIILPVVLLALLIIIQFGKLYLKKQATTNIIKDTIEYGLKHTQDEQIENKLNNLIETNIDDIDIKTITIFEDEIRINLTQKSINIFGKNINLTYDYTGTKMNEEIRIEEG